jgi:hypothetical protein
MRIGAFEIRHGDRVAFVDRDGKRRTGRANGLLLFPTHCVLDMGGRYGTPQVVTPDMIVRVQPKAGYAPQPSAPARVRTAGELAAKAKALGLGIVDDEPLGTLTGDLFGEKK